MKIRRRGNLRSYGVLEVWEFRMYDVQAKFNNNCSRRSYEQRRILKNG